MPKVKDLISLLEKLDPEMQVLEPAVIHDYTEFHLYRITQSLAFKTNTRFWQDDGNWKECKEASEAVLIIN